MKNIKSLFVILIYVILLTNTCWVQATEPPTTKHRPRIGLVLSGGGAKGLAHIGVLKVLEQAGIYPDYIGGTSMGSIIGALYAVGYSADSIKSMVLKLDWQELLTDKINRRDLSMDDKLIDGKYFAPIPIRNGKFELPTGVVAGQNISLLFNHLLFSQYAENDFTKFPIPFLCVAADVVKGEAVVLKEGYVAEAIRASMAIPTVFTPVDVEGKLLIDGGVFNNLPVTEIKNMGADIIIAVNVGFTRYNKEQLKSFVAILEQAFFIQNQKDVEARLERSDYVITPRVGEYGAASFDKSDSLIKIGEAAAREQFGRFKRLADSLNSLYPQQKMKPASYTPHDSVYIDAFEINGLKSIPRSLVRGYFDFVSPTWVTVNQIENGIKRLYGTMYFNIINYRIVKRMGGYTLQLNTEEKPQSRYTVGVNFNSDFNASLQVNAQINNLLFDGSRLNVNALLGEQPVLDASYVIDNTWSPFLYQLSNKRKWKWDIGTSVYAANYKFDYYVNAKRLSSFNVSNFIFSLFTQTVFSNSVSFGVGVQGEFNMLVSDLFSFDFPSEKKNLFNVYSYLRFDNLDKSYFATKGLQVQVESKYLTPINYSNKSVPYASLRLLRAVPINDMFAIHYGVNGGVTFADSTEGYYHFLAGGMNSFTIKNSFRFLGYNHLELYGLNMWATQLDLQSLIYKKHYITLKSNVGLFKSKTIDLISIRKLKYGVGLSYGYNTFIGPLEFTLMHSGDHNLMAHFTVGFWF